MTPTKALNANQHLPLHEMYGVHDCCLCRIEAERDALRARVAALEEAGEGLAELAAMLPVQPIFTNETELMAPPWFERRARAVARWREVTDDKSL